MKKIKLTRGKYVIVDDEDYHYLSRFNWYLRDDGKGHYGAERAVPAKKDGTKLSKYTIAMADMIVCKGRGKSLISHKNRNTLDYRKKNLIVTGWSSTRHNQIVSRKNKTSRYRGVAKRKGVNGKNGGELFRMLIQKNRIKYQKSFNTERKAALAYNKKARELYGDFAYQNKI